MFGETFVGKKTCVHFLLQRHVSSLIHCVVQLPSCVRLCVTPWTAAHQASVSFTISQSLLKLVFIELVMPSNYLILCCPLLLQPSVFPSIRVFSSELALCIRGPQYWSFSFNISRSSEYSGLISFRIHWFSGTCNSWFQTLAVLPFQMIL